ncbi:FecR family protein [Butyricimonas paravirosa]|uniref:FecR family protein n=1 Tax=Butyricimonas paravirosa TaxID=1472417 RepID=UPI00210BF387|nr:FecR family protein [Butyricimonas paravirosa]MCQ4873601.1 FecR domain-containing protein [Butyricimonas paravirosa]
MGLSKKHFRIAKILASLFTETQTEKEKEEYEEWEKEQEGNRDLAKYVLDQENYIRFERTASRFDQQAGWEVFKDHLAIKSSDIPGKTKRVPDLQNASSDKRQVQLKYFMRYAAVGIILIACGIFYWIGQPVKEKQDAVFAYQIEAGTTGARLIMADGKVVDIVKDQTFLIKETDGTVIVTDSTGIDYVAHEVKDEKEIRNTMQTLTGMEYTLTLSDGTKVYLNAESKIDFPVSFKGVQRVVELSGEAYFEVAKDAEHPFIVKTLDLSVKVLGTSFNLRAYEDEKAVTTTLAEGKVQVFDGQKFKDIIPGEQVVYEKATKSMLVSQVEIARYTSWRDGKFIFRNERLEDIMMYLARWYNVQYKFMDDKVKDIRIGAKLNRYNNMNPIIDMLKMNSTISVSLVDNVYYISSK